MSQAIQIGTWYPKLGWDGILKNGPKSAVPWAPWARGHKRWPPKGGGKPAVNCAGVFVTTTSAHCAVELNQLGPTLACTWEPSKRSHEFQEKYYKNSFQVFPNADIKHSYPLNAQALSLLRNIIASVVNPNKPGMSAASELPNCCLILRCMNSMISGSTSLDFWHQLQMSRKFRAEFGAGEESVRETGDGCGECRATTPQPDLPS